MPNGAATPSGTCEITLREATLLITNFQIYEKIQLL